MAKPEYCRLGPNPQRGNWRAEIEINKNMKININQDVQQYLCATTIPPLGVRGL